jgi:2-succinyl-5-enolpyruvyl-6-hydroxy-3-cyclohexene-1-carboxylate synthase
MKVKVNRNNLWSAVFLNQLAALGVRHACISPGSRSTPLAYTLSRNKKIKCYVHIDERSSAFFALGLAKATGSPVVIVTTSGTAVAELYPAIIEAYQQRTPLIICTADRPAELIGTGSNQTINQHNIFRNQIRLFRDLGLPSISDTGFYYLQKIAVKAFRISQTENRGPVHLNFPFDKPLEPFSYTDKVSKRITQLKPQRFSRHKAGYSSSKFIHEKTFKRIVNETLASEKGIIITGPMEYDKESIRAIKDLAVLLIYPVFADSISHLRFSVNKNEQTIISNFNSLLASEKFSESHQPDVILQFGRTPTSSSLESFLEKTNANRYLVNAYGDKFDPTRNSTAALAVDPVSFCKALISNINDEKFKRNKSVWLKDFIHAEEVSEKIKLKITQRSKFPNEPSIITEILKIVPTKSNIFIGNSLPVRDLDYFVSKTDKKLFLHFNRGASGIDGITSTALGIASRKKPTVLITGDLSFLHDLNALATAVKYSIPLSIIVINNNGGGIFESLPIANRIKHFSEFFITPHNLEFAEIVKSFGINYHLITTLRELQRHLKSSLNKNFPSVLEIQTDAAKSVQLRNKFFSEVKKSIDKELP